MSDVSVSGGYLHVFNRDGVEVLRAVGEALLSEGSVLSTLRPHARLAWNLARCDF